MLRFSLFKKYDFDELISMGTKLDYSGNYQEALKCFDKALKINSNSANTLISKATVLDNLGNSVDALALYSKAIEMNYPILVDSRH